MNCHRLTKLILSLTLMIFLCFGGVSAANQTSPVQPSTHQLPAKAFEANTTISPDSSNDVVNSESLSAVGTELKILKEKNVLIADFQSSLISIVIWSLSAVVSVVILLVGASLFTNFKMHEKDIQRIQQDYDAKIKIFRSDFDAILAKANQEMASAQETRSQQDLNRMLDQASQVRSLFETVRASLEERLDQLQTEKTNLETKFNSLDRNQATLRTDLFKNETHIWKIKKIPSNILLTAMQGIEAALACKDNWRTEDFISQAKDVITSAFIEPKITLDAKILELIEPKLVTLENARPKDAQEIRDLIAKCS
ncbi:hypothetical protein [Pseudomonas sp. NPDC087626]|uniref:hypothetical protein n=1 Tax=Pseudomonas sp. NPDC087626 TaxID=3364444 RepID=UPI00382E2994